LWLLYTTVKAFGFKIPNQCILRIYRQQWQLLYQLHTYMFFNHFIEVI
jgi:hypothetical protein